MAKRRFFEFILKLINFFLTLFGLTLIVFAVYRLVKWKKTSIESHSNKSKLELSRRILLAVHQSNNKFWSAWFLYLFIAIGIALFVISCFGCVGTATRSRCCLCFYSVLMAGLVLVELGLAGFIHFSHNWMKEIPTDKTGTFRVVDHFLNSNWKIIKWIALAVFILEIMALLLALYLQHINRESYDFSDDEIIVQPGFRPNIIESKSTPTTGRPIRGAKERMSPI